MFWRGLLETIVRMDRLFAVSILLLLSISLVTLASLSTATPLPFFERQVVWALLGVLVYIIAAHFDYRILRNYSGLLLAAYLILVGILVLLPIVGREVRGVISWFRFGSFAVEPGEFMKIVLILLLAKYFSRRHVEIYRLRNILISGVYAGIPTVLILTQPDLGTAAILVAIWFGILLFSGIRPKHLLLFFLVGIVAAAAAWGFLLAPYQQNRIVSFLNPWNDPLGSGYNAIQSMVAVGSGQLFGKGVGYGSQTHLSFLPEPATDFIFAAFAEEWGFIGVIFLLLIYSLFFWRLFRIGIRAGDNFARLVILGMTTMFFVHVIIHIGMNIGILPITGITLPFLSYGGSSLLSAMALAGFAQSIAIRSLKSGALIRRESYFEPA